MLKIKSAFTLAEILIVLAIIGVLAVLLIPRTLSNMNSESAHAKFRNTYVQIQKVLKIAKENYKEKESLFEIKGNNISATMNKVDDYMKAHFNVKKMSDDKVHPLQGEDGNGRTYQFPSGAQLVIPDDTATIMAGTNGCEVTTTLANKCLMYIDINGGDKKPNLVLGTVVTSGTDNTPDDNTGACKTGTQYAINTEIHKHVFDSNVPACEVSNDLLFDIYPIVFEEDDLKPYSNAVAYILENKND